MFNLFIFEKTYMPILLKFWKKKILIPVEFKKTLPPHKIPLDQFIKKILKKYFFVRPPTPFLV